MSQGRCIVNRDGNIANVTDNSQDINIKHTNSEIVNELFLNYTGVLGKLKFDVNKDSVLMELTSQTVGDFSPNDLIRISEEGKWEISAVRITSISSQTIYINRPLDNSYTRKAIIEKVYDDLATAGLSTSASVISPVIFKVFPVNNRWKFTRLLIQMLGNEKHSDDTFGDLDGGLANGILLRKITALSSRTLSFWRSNGDIGLDVGVDLQYREKGEAGTKYGASARWTFLKAGVVKALDSENGEYLELRIQDDITSLVSFKIKAQGYIYNERT